MPDTLGDHPRIPRGERRIICDYCGMTWYRSSMVKDPSGYWACPDDQDGRDGVTLNRLNQQAAMATRPPANRGPTDW
jgi:hypothetical protein